MSSEIKHFYEFGNFRFDPKKRVLWRYGEVVQLAPRASEVLLLLLENHGHLLEREELLQKVWKDAFVEEGNLNHAISALRKTLGGNGIIKTVPRRGYRFTADVREVFDESNADLVIEKHTLSHTLIEEDEEIVEDEKAIAPKAITTPASRKQNRNSFVLAIAGLFLITTIGAAWYLRSDSNNKPLVTKNTIQTVAVLPFKSLNDETNQAHLGLGLADSLNIKLGGIKQFVVRPTSVVLNQSKDENDPLEIGRRLNVDVVLEGSVQTEGERVRVRLRLLRVADGAQIWAGQFDEPLNNLFALQDSISAQITDAFALHLSNEEKRHLAKHYTDNADAYQYYVKGIYEQHKGTVEGLKKSLEHFQKSIAEDPRYPLPHAGMSISYNVLSSFGVLAPDEAMPKAEEAARRAVELDNGLSEAHLALAMVKAGYNWDWASAENHFKKAIDLAPNASSPRNTYAHFLLVMNRPDEAIAESRHALEISPSDVYMNEDLAFVYLVARHYDEAAEQARKTLSMDERAYGAFLILGWIHEQQGRYAEAIAEIERARSIEPNNIFVEVEFGYNLARAGRRDEAEKILNKLKNSREYVSPYHLAILSAGFEDKEQTLANLNKAFEQRVGEMITLKNQTKFDFLRGNSRFQEILEKMNFPQ